MSKNPLFAAAALLAPVLFLAACDSQPTTVTANGSVDPMADELANAAPVELPPAIRDSKTYRCADNSLVYVAFLADDLTANFRTEPNAAPTKLTAAAAGEAFVAEGYSVSGSGETVTIARPGKSGQTCKA